ncbi:MAG TPA: hypothetical protein PJ986_02735 [Gammaproteobacteria bacterium]|nr:hypothetical protein [Gammaproteobacteria bacterium]
MIFLPSVFSVFSVAITEHKRRHRHDTMAHTQRRRKRHTDLLFTPRRRAFRRAVRRALRIQLAGRRFPPALDRDWLAEASILDARLRGHDGGAALPRHSDLFRGGPQSRSISRNGYLVQRFCAI